MALPNIFELCIPRDDVANGTISDSDYAANIANVPTGFAPPNYTDAPAFFTNTYPTEGLKELLVNVCGRLSGRGESVSAVFRLDTSFCRGKTYGLIAIVHTGAGLKTRKVLQALRDPVSIPRRQLSPEERRAAIAIIKRSTPSKPRGQLKRLHQAVPARSSRRGLFTPAHQHNALLSR